MPEGLGLLAYLNELREPLRLPATPGLSGFQKAIRP